MLDKLGSRILVPLRPLLLYHALSYFVNFLVIAEGFFDPANRQ